MKRMKISMLFVSFAISLILVSSNIFAAQKTVVDAVGRKVVVKDKANRLVAVGVPAIVVLPETFKTLNDTLRLIATAVGDPSLANKSIEASERILTLAGERVGSIPAEQRKSVYFASSLGFFNTASGSMLMNDIVNMAGGVMVSRELKGYFKNISPETFIKWNPDLVTVNSRSKALAVETLARPEFKSISAVSKNQVYGFPCNLAPWDYPSPLTVLSVLWMGEKLYPNKFSDLNVMQEVNDFHQNLFAKSFTELGGKLADQLQ
jgi:iron complex transport system substrate-binding protein